MPPAYEDVTVTACGAIADIESRGVEWCFAYEFGVKNDVVVGVLRFEDFGGKLGAV